MKIRTIFLAGMAVCVIPVYLLVQNYADSHALVNLRTWHLVVITAVLSAVIALVIAAVAGRLFGRRPI